MIRFDLLFIGIELSNGGLVFQFVPANPLYKSIYSQHKSDH